MTDTLAPLLARVAAGARTHAGRGPRERAALARETARATAATMRSWAEVAAEIKRAAGPTAAVVRAEETATGPFGTLRLLLLTAAALDDVARIGLPRLPRPPRHQAGPDGGFVAVDTLPVRSLLDPFAFAGQEASVRCVDPGGLAAFELAWRREVEERPRSGGVAAVLGAGNVSGLAAADAIAQIFEYGRGVVLKLHPLHGSLAPVLEEALRPLVAAGVLAIVVGAADVAAALVADPTVTHVHLTGGQAAFDALVWGGPGPWPPGTRPRLGKPITCELGNVTPWIVVPGAYPARQLAAQADMVAASIINNTSFNCLATKCIVTASRWPQREAFLERIRSRLASVPARPAWYPGAAAAWEQLTGRPPTGEGTLPWLLRAGIDPDRESRWIEREWFVPAAVEIPLEAETVDGFCGGAADLVRRLPGSLAASVTAPLGLAAADARRVESFTAHLPFGVVARDAWSALAFTAGNVPWGGFPGATLDRPRSGIGRVHDPLLLPLVHNSILRGPAVPRPAPPWLPWHPHGEALAVGLAEAYGRIAAGRSGIWRLLRMLPAVYAC